MIRRLSEAYKRCETVFSVRSERADRTDETTIRHNGERPSDERKSSDYDIRE